MSKRWSSGRSQFDSAARIKTTQLLLTYRQSVKLESYENCYISVKSCGPEDLRPTLRASVLSPSADRFHIPDLFPSKNN